MPSLASAFMPTIIRLLGAKRMYSSAEATRADAARLQLRPASFSPPRSLDRKVEISSRLAHGMRLYTVRPRGAAPVGRAMFLHGGSWTHEITRSHWHFVADVAVRASTEFIVPIYPLAPAATAGVVIPALTDLATELVAEHGPEGVTLIGDSAGASMTLAVALLVKARGLPPAGHTVLISPGLDLRFDDPAMAAIAPRDPFLALPGLKVVGRLWAGDLPIDDPLVSPINGDLRGLAPITMFSSTRDILSVDARRLVRAAKDAGVTIDYYEAVGMIHDFPMLPIPEADRAREVIAAVLRS